MPELPADQVRQLVTVIDGLPLIMEEVVQQIAEGGPAAARPDLGRSTLASAVRLRLNGVSEDCRTVLNALSVIGDTDPAVLLAVTGLDPDRLGRALHAGLASTLLVSATNSLGVGWRHLLIRRAVRAELLPLEQQLIAGRAADQLAHDDSPTDGHLHHAARLYELAGHRQDAAQALIRAARAAVDHAALDLAERYLADAERLSGGLPHGAEEVLVERIETLSVAGRARDAYDSGVAALGGIEQAEPRRLLAATTRAAFAGGLIGEGRDLLATLENQSQPADADLMVLRAQAAFADHDPRAVALARDAARQARTEGRVDLECEAFVIAGSQATWTETEQAIDLFRRAIKLSQQHRLPRWEVRAKAALGVIDMMTDSDLTRLEQTRRLAADAGMVGAVAAMDMYIGLAEVVRRGFVAARPILLRADVQARKLRLRELRAHTYCHLIECHLVADQPLPGRTSSGAVLDVDAAVAQATALAERAHAKLWLKSAFGVRAWLRGDTATAIEMIERDVQDVRDQIKVAPWLGFWQLLQVAEGADPAETFQAIHLTGHHVNWAARALGLALGQLREGRPADEPLADADRLLRNAPYWGHVLRTVIAPAAFDAGHPAAEGWLREAEAFFAASGEWPLQRRVRQAIAGIGGKVPRTTASIPPHLARFGITARETEILRLINSGLSNAEIAEQLVISIRTVETHVSSLLQKTGTAGRDQLPEA
jgi:DNA-binding CsgD family transcriptional regulator